MRLSRPIFILLVGLFAIAAGMGFTAPKTTLEQVENQVYCLCGCTTLLSRCPHLPSECASRAQMEALIKTDISQGKTDPAILQDLVSRFGVRVLAAPPAKGFDLSVWILPGVGLILGLITVIIIVRRLRRKSLAGVQQDSPGAVDPKVMAAIEEEMNKMDSLSH